MSEKTTIKGPLPMWMMGSIKQYGLDEQLVRDALQGWCEGRPMPPFDDLRPKPAVIPAPLFCPYCKKQHIDEGEWATKPHHTHLCAFCSRKWRVEPYCVGTADFGLDARFLNVATEARSFLVDGLYPGMKDAPIGSPNTLWALAQQARDRLKQPPTLAQLIDEGDRQMLVLALAELSLRRPGWYVALYTLAIQFQASEMFMKFRETSSGAWGLPLEAQPTPVPGHPAVFPTAEMDRLVEVRPMTTEERIKRDHPPRPHFLARFLIDAPDSETALHMFRTDLERWAKREPGKMEGQGFIHTRWVTEEEAASDRLVLASEYKLYTQSPTENRGQLTLEWGMEIKATGVQTERMSVTEPNAAQPPQTKESKPHSEASLRAAWNSLKRCSCGGVPCIDLTDELFYYVRCPQCDRRSNYLAETPDHDARQRVCADWNERVTGEAQKPAPDDDRMVCANCGQRVSGGYGHYNGPGFTCTKAKAEQPFRYEQANRTIDFLVRLIPKMEEAERNLQGESLGPADFQAFINEAKGLLIPCDGG